VAALLLSSTGANKLAESLLLAMGEGILMNYPDDGLLIFEYSCNRQEVGASDWLYDSAIFPPCTG